jgi:4-amino-4-deoxy-L-arabinose transferase-like glycosyltransferase
LAAFLFFKSLAFAAVYSLECRLLIIKVYPTSMRFQLDHDWQSNISSPPAKLGESTKTQLLLILCAIWILTGLIGHAPWKPLESTSISIVKSILDGGSQIAPLAKGDSTLEAPPLYYAVAALSAKLFSAILLLHDGARVFNSIWLTILLLMIGMTGREMWSRGVGRHATFIMIGSVGLMLSAHSLNHEIAALSALATGFYALALFNRRQGRATLFFGLAIGMGFLIDGIVTPLILLCAALTLFILFKAWRRQSFVLFVLISALLATPFIVGWLWLIHQYFPEIYIDWMNRLKAPFIYENHAYFCRILIWYAWPALPLALLGIWKFRAAVFSQPRFQLPIVFFVVSFIILGFASTNKDIQALPLLIPLVVIGAGSVEQLKRDFAAALNWFAVTLFSTLGLLIWLGWLAIVTGFPEKLQERMRFLSGLYTLNFELKIFVLAILMTLIWFIVSLRAKLTKRSTVTNWAIGMTFVWCLLMTLWLPMIDSAKTYANVFTSLKKAMPAEATCINSLNVGKAQAYLFDYYTNITLQPFERTQQLNCNLYLIQDEKGTGKMIPGAEWQLIWQGKRAADRKESFRLFQRQAI